MKKHTVLLCDLDAFFAAVEILDQPALAGRPVVVGGRPGSRGVVATCNYEARRYGIRSAMPLAEARRRCPHAVFLPTRHHRYRELSRQVLSIYRRYTPVIEPVSIDEAYLDLGHRPGLPVARAIKQAVKRETGLIVSIGVGGNKFLAKLACELAKPDGLREISDDQAPQVLPPLPVRMLPGVGPKTGERLSQLGVKLIGDLWQYPIQWFIDHFGKRGYDLYYLARGIDHRPVSPISEVKSISDETTFPVDRKATDVLPSLRSAAQEVGSRLRKAGRRAQTVTIKVRFADFVTITRSRTLSFPFDSDEIIYREARNLFQQHVLASSPAAFGHGKGPGPRLIRLLGVQVSNLQPVTTPYQINLFDHLG